MPSARPLIEGELARRQRCAHLADALLQRDDGRLLFAVGAGQDGVFDHQAGDARGLQFLHGAHDIQRVAVAVIGVDHQRQLAGAVDAVRLGGELGQR